MQPEIDKEFKTDEKLQYSRFLKLQKPNHIQFSKKGFPLQHEKFLLVSEFRFYSSTPRLTRKLHAVTMDTMLTFIIFENK